MLVTLDSFWVYRLLCRRCQGLANQESIVH